MKTPLSLEVIGTDVAIRWSDGQESYHAPTDLRRASPSAEVQGERDIFGNQYGGHAAAPISPVQVTAWEIVGNYAVRFEFSDGHRTGLYTFDYLRKLAGLT